MIRHALWAIALTTLFACKKSSKQDPGPGNPPPPPVTGKPFITAKGAVSGEIYSAVIGTAGGRLQTPDGGVSIQVPAGALAGDQTVSIQAVSNTLRPDRPSLFAYRLLPENVTFTKPVTVMLKYDRNALTPGAEEMLMLAWQDANGTWKPLATTLDKGNNAVSATVTHFCDFAVYEQFELFAAKTQVSAGQEVAFRCGVQEISPNQDSLLAPLEHKVDDNSFVRPIVSNYSMLHDKYAARATGWKVVSGGGEITAQKNPFGLDANAVYKAPATVNTVSTAVVEVTLEGLTGVKDPAAQGGTRKPEKLVLRKTIHLVPSGDATFMRIEIDYEPFMIAPQQPMYSTWELTDPAVGIFEAGIPNGYNCKIVLTNPKIGTWPCGPGMSAATEALITYHFDPVHFAESEYCQKVNGNAVTKYSTGQLTISKVGNAGEPIEGEFIGKIYKSVDNVNCAFQVHHLKVTFRFLRFS